MRKLKSETTFQIVINIILIFLTLCSLLPFVLLIMSSVTQESALIADGYQFWPRVFSLDAYRYIIARAGTIFKAYGITMLVTLVGTTISLIITPLLAYPLSRQDFKLHNVMSFLVFFTMLFNGGLVPTYMMWTQIFHIKNTLPALIIPALLLNAFNVMLMKNYFKMNIPYSLIEAAKIDGAGEFFIFYRVVMPLSKPIMATVGLFVGINYWNDWMNGLYYVTDANLFSLQNFLNRMMQNINYLATAEGAEVAQGSMIMPSSSMRMALAVIGVLPIMVLYPFFQKYFVKGMTVGSVKG
ncbi:carbohydrate ABC transporter permease [Schaedlerella arabinosiphila]|uniref:Carbohydrate ABC transporter permease n=1 Tax=Schaedlerella arabinosiphila TaxID=2044587 RepID=A0A3R8R227_9FIRM|nr:carbohydrate ABC transporter permease [Schaedlerella arabinosiphila]MCI9212226.1 carbohydrate ABC transporter permease [Ruminococcus sp.]MCI9633954.1 carbohydrate ABC transporter permease [Ruminococcus sp.]RRK30471.1 carbohydrate ABC transporter permease [Schaedlerella arabinosiphila]